MSKDIIKLADVSYDERYKLLKKVTNKNKKILLELRKATSGFRPYVVICWLWNSLSPCSSYENKCFFTQFFANRYYNYLCKKYFLKDAAEVKVIE